jgi:glutathione S-transferase
LRSKILNNLFMSMYCNHFVRCTKQAVFYHTQKNKKLILFLYFILNLLKKEALVYLKRRKRLQDILLKRLQSTDKALPYVAKLLGDKQYLNGDEYSAADLFWTYELSGFHLKGKACIQKFPTLVEYIKRLEARPSYTEWPAFLT